MEIKRQYKNKKKKESQIMEEMISVQRDEVRKRKKEKMDGK